MKLQARNLEPNMRGDDVLALQATLRQLGFSIVDQNGFFGSTTIIGVQGFQQQHNLPATGIVDARTARVLAVAEAAQPREGYVAKGKVVQADGSPVAGVSVAVFAKRLRDERPLGNDQTDEQGRFEITYPAPDQMPLSIFVRTRVRDEITVSGPVLDARPVEEFTLVVSGAPLRGPSEYRRIEAAMRPALADEQMDPADLEEDDVRFLAARLGLDPGHTALYVLSARLHRETGILAEAYYGLLRQGLPGDLVALVAQPTKTLSSALESAAADNIIRAELEPTIPRLLRALQSQVSRLALRDPEPARPTFAALFDIAGVDARHRQRIVETYVTRDGTVEDYWQQLRDDPDIANEQLDALQDILRLSTIALNHVDLVRHITRLRRTGAIGPHLRDLGQLEAAQWRDILNTEVGGQKIGAPAFFGADEQAHIDRYAEFLARMVESVFPTGVLMHRLAARNGGGIRFRPGPDLPRAKSRVRVPHHLSAGLSGHARRRDGRHPGCGSHGRHAQEHAALVSDRARLQQGPCDCHAHGPGHRLGDGHPAHGSDPVYPPESGRPGVRRGTRHVHPGCTPGGHGSDRTQPVYCVQPYPSCHHRTAPRRPGRTRPRGPVRLAGPVPLRALQLDLQPSGVPGRYPALPDEPPDGVGQRHRAGCALCPPGRHRRDRADMP